MRKTKKSKLKLVVCRVVRHLNFGKVVYIRESQPPKMGKREKNGKVVWMMVGNTQKNGDKCSEKRKKQVKGTKVHVTDVGRKTGSAMPSHG